MKTVNHSGMRSVCVCQYYQNVKLLVSVIPSNFEYKDILSKVVCNIDLRKCMLHLCSDCPGKTKLNMFSNRTFYKPWIWFSWKYFFTNSGYLCGLGESLFNCWRIYCKIFWWWLWSLPVSFHCKSTTKPFKNSQRKLI